MQPLPQTDAATLYIANGPAAGTNQTLTNPGASGSMMVQLGWI